MLFSPGIVAALTWPASLLSVASVIDNPWGVCLHRSAEVGKHLAHILLSRQQVPGNSGGWARGSREARGLTCAQTSYLRLTHMEVAQGLWGSACSSLLLQFKSQVS